MDNLKPTLSSLALKFAISQLGVTEAKGHNNTGKEVNAYLASVGLQPGNSWCMAFVYWCYMNAALQLKISTPLIRTGGVLFQWQSIQPTRRVLPQTAVSHPEIIKPGSIFIMDFGGGKGHTGIVESFDGKIIQTVEGNSNDDGSREGYEVCRKPHGRKIESMKGFIIT